MVVIGSGNCSLGCTRRSLISVHLLPELGSGMNNAGIPGCGIEKAWLGKVGDLSLTGRWCAGLGKWMQMRGIRMYLLYADGDWVDRCMQSP